MQEPDTRRLFVACPTLRGTINGRVPLRRGAGVALDLTGGGHDRSRVNRQTIDYNLLRNTALRLGPGKPGDAGKHHYRGKSGSQTTRPFHKNNLLGRSGLYLDHIPLNELS